MTPFCSVVLMHTSRLQAVHQMSLKKSLDPARGFLAGHIIIIILSHCVGMKVVTMSVLSTVYVEVSKYF